VKKTVLGVPVDLVDQSEAVREILQWSRSGGDKVRVVATAYSEFFVNAVNDIDFRMALEGSDLVTPDGIGPLAAIYFNGIVKSEDSTVVKLLKGLKTGLAVLTRKVGQPVSGYWLFNALIDKAAKEGFSVFLLGGFDETASKLAEKIRNQHQGIRLESDAGVRFGKLAEIDKEKDATVVAKINKFKPDLLFVAYGPVKQEKWLAAHRNELKVKVAMGVGGTFDEALGLVKEAPVFMSQIGLKWLWRLLQQPRRLPRIIKATVVFAWLVFVESLQKGK